MASFKKFIVEIHRRSLWQVLAAYIGASWFVMEATDQIVDRYLLPEWVYPAALILLLVGLPIVLATALVREDKREPEPESIHEVRDPTLLGDVSQEAARPAVALARKPIAKFLTWPRAIAGGLAAFTALGLVSAYIVVRGSARVAEAHGAAGESFEERGWIVVADFEAPDDEAETALAAQTALTLDLQQSKYVNVRTRNQVAPVLRLMGVPDTVRLDEQLALEVAQREGLAAVLAASISRLGSDYVLGARVIEPGDLDELIAVRSVVGQDRLVEGVETLSRELRKRLGEERAAIRDSKPLPRVTTQSLEALKKYAQGSDANNRFQDYPTAAEFATQAIALDSSFASAYRLAAVGYVNMGRVADASAKAKRAYELRDRQTDRERFGSEAFYQFLVEGDPRAAATTYGLFLSQYPDASSAANNAAVFAGAYLGEYERAYEAAIRSLEIDPYSANSYGVAITNARWTDRRVQADSLIRVARERGFEDLAVRHLRIEALLQDDWTRAEVLCDSLLADPAGPVWVIRDQSYCGALDMARGRIDRAIGRIESAATMYAQFSQYRPLVIMTDELVRAEQMRGRVQAARTRIERFLTDVDATSIGELDRPFVRYTLTGAIGQLAASDVLDQIETTYPPDRDLDNRLAELWIYHGDVARALAEGRPEVALSSLRELDALGFNGSFIRPAANLAFAQTFDALAEVDSAIAHFETFIHPIHVAQDNFVRSYLPVVVRRLAELEESRGNAEAAIEHYRRLLELWSDADPELQGQVTSAQRALARLTVAES